MHIWSPSWQCPLLLPPHTLPSRVWPQEGAGRDQPGAGSTHSSWLDPPFAPVIWAAAQQMAPHTQQEMAGGAMGSCEDKDNSRLRMPWNALSSLAVRLHWARTWCWFRRRFREMEVKADLQLTLLFSTKTLNRVMGQEEKFCNTVIDMYHKTKQGTDLPLPSEVPVIKKSYPGMKRSSPGVEESCIKFLYVTVWILHMGVSLKAVFFSHDIILCFAYKWWWVSSIRLSSDFRKLEENKMKRKPKQSLTLPWYVQEWLFLPASYVFIFSSYPLFENRHIFAEIQKFWLHSVYASLYTGESLLSVVPSILCLLFVSENERWDRETQMKSWTH